MKGCLDARLAAETFEEAAESAMEEMKGKLATRYHGDDDDDDGVIIVINQINYNDDNDYDVILF